MWIIRLSQIASHGLSSLSVLSSHNGKFKVLLSSSTSFSPTLYFTKYFFTVQSLLFYCNISLNQLFAITFQNHSVSLSVSDFHSMFTLFLVFLLNQKYCTVIRSQCQIQYLLFSYHWITIRFSTELTLITSSSCFKYHTKIL